jgi:hypothetical protein
MTATTNQAGDRPAESQSDPAPGGPEAKAQGCVCSVLANAAYRAGADHEPCIDPLCRLHATPGAPDD